jgi:hypothetical protein
MESAMNKIEIDAALADDKRVDQALVAFYHARMLDAEGMNWREMEMRAMRAAIVSFLENKP